MKWPWTKRESQHEQTRAKVSEAFRLVIEADYAHETVTREEIKNWIGAMEAKLDALTRLMDERTTEGRERCIRLDNFFKERRRIEALATTTTTGTTGYFQPTMICYERKPDGSWAKAAFVKPKRAKKNTKPKQPKKARRRK